jgi:K+-sensing histidine kinase KdpD
VVQGESADNSGGAGNALLRSVAEQLKMPLATIARHAELGQLTGQPQLADLGAIRTHASAALTLVDSYLLGLQLLREQTMLTLEPVSISSLLVETAHELESFAKQYDTKLELRIGGKYEPVMAHPHGLKSALLALGYALLQGYPTPEGGSMSLAVHRTPHGLVTGLYGNYERLSSESWRKALALQGRATKPLNGLTGSGAGLFVADAILQAMESKLRVGKHQKQHGLAATLQPSQQLSFV